MSISYASNASSLKAITRLNSTTKKLSSTFERLSTGLRINKASDDPGGLAVADKLRADTRLATVAVRNTNDGISMVSIVDSALEEIYNILNRMSELAEQSSNGTYTNAQRSALSSEFLALGSEIERIATTTEYNSSKLLSNSSNVTLQVGIDGTANSTITVQSVLGTLASLNLSPSGSSKLTYSIISTTTTESKSAAAHALTAVKSAIDLVIIRRGTVGAAESRLNKAVSLLAVARDNYAAAESTIRDADIAEETANLTRLTILQQAATAVIAQANLQPQIALSLLS